jgi:hypothetical protein
MGQVFRRKQFTDYLGENRAILDIKTDYVIPPTPSPSPSSTPSPTPTPTPSPTPFSPSLTNMVFWYDLSNPSNVALRTSGGTDYVETIYDLSPNGFDISQTDTNRQAIYTLDSFGNRCAVFDGVDDYMILTGITSITSVTGWSSYMVFQINDYSVTQGPVGPFNTSPLGMLYADGTDILNSYGANDIWSFSPLSTWDKQPNFLFHFRSTTGITTTDIALNDIAPVSGGTFADVTSLSSIILAVPVISPNLYSFLTLKEAVVYKTNLSDGDNTQIITYLKNKWDYTSW